MSLHKAPLKLPAMMAEQSHQTSGLMHYPCVFCRPIDKHSFSVNERSLHRAKFAAIGRNRAVVPHHEKALLRHNNLTHRPAVAVVFRNIPLAQWFAIEPDLAVVNPQPVSGQSDHALDVALLGIAWIVEDHHVPSLDC